MDLISHFKKEPWYKSLPAGLQQQIVASGKSVVFSDGQLIYAAGDFSNGFFGVVSGSVKMVHLTQKGSCAGYYLKQPPSWFGEMAECDGGRRMQNAVAVGNVKLLHLSHKAFRLIVNENPQYWEYFALLAAGRIRVMFDFVESLITCPAPVRLARALLDVRKTAARASNTAPAITQDELAAMVGVTRQTISKTLKRLQEEGVVTLGYRSIEITDLNGIRRIAALSARRAGQDVAFL
ncbi:Crp/Fnr family transcriptional regulator [Bradyrhizobium sp.]|uniref:Crp/Fnr family transcriptional regulator n=1 Tax=Bradyrhizobium sp. TaxID=376 RepID=UPI0039E5D81D